MEDYTQIESELKTISQAAWLQKYLQMDLAQFNEKYTFYFHIFLTSPPQKNYDGDLIVP